MKPEEPSQKIEQNQPLKLRASNVRLAIVVCLLLMAVVMTLILGLEYILPPLIIALCVALLSNVAWRFVGKNIKYKSYFATVIDIFLITVAIHYIGGIETPLAWVYAVALLAIGSLRGVRVSIFAAVVSSLMYSSLLIAEFAGVIPHVDFGLLNPKYLHQDKFYLFIKLLSDNVLFFITAAVSGILSERLIRHKNNLETIKKDLEKGNEQLQLEMAERKRAEETLRKSEARYRGMVEDQTEMICRFLPGGDLTYVNEVYCRYFQKTYQELVGSSFLSLIPDEDQYDVKKRFESISSEDSVFTHEHRIITSRGDIGWQQWTNRAIYDEYGELTEFQAVGRDITERKLTELSLKASEERYRMVVEEANDIICTVDMKTGMISNVNNFAEKTLGYKYEEIVDKRGFVELVHPDDHEKLFGRLQELAQEKSRKPNFPARLLKADGTFIHVEINGTVVYDKEGKPETFIGVIRDVTERKHAEQALQESEEKHRQVVENANEIILVHQDGIIKYCNPITTKLTGYSEAELAVTPFIEFIHPEDREMVLDYHLRRSRGEEILHKYSLRVICKDGTIKWMEADAVIVDWEGKPGALSFLDDITEKKQLEQQLFQAQKMESVGTLAGGIAHDFNNLLAGILGYASLTKTKIPKEHQIFSYIDTIEKSATRAAELTSQLLAFARGGKYESEPVNLNGVIKETLKIIGRTFEKHIEIETNFLDSLPTVEADAGQMQQALMNLCVNARDAMPDGGKLMIETKVTPLTEDYAKTHAEVKPGLYVNLSVTDTGLGMDNATMQRIFEPFFTTKEKGKGTGLGLAMVYGVVKNHGGYIYIYSEPGEGSTFRLYLPVSGKSEVKALCEEETIRCGNELILVVDDEESIRSLAKNMLESYGYRVLLAEDGARATEVLKEENGSIDLVILDLIMPKMGGGETFLKLKEINPKVKVVLSTGFGQDGRAQEILDGGALGFLQKPYQLSTLMSKVRSVLDDRRST